MCFCCVSVADKDMEERVLAALSTGQKKIKIEIQDLKGREATQKLKEQIEQAETADNGRYDLYACSCILSTCSLCSL